MPIKEESGEIKIPPDTVEIKPVPEGESKKSQPPEIPEARVETLRPDEDTDAIEAARRAVQASSGEEERTAALVEFPKLSELDRKFVDNEVTRFSQETRFSLPALFAGNKTATEYDSRVTNYSTHTRIVTLEDGRKLFVVKNYPTSFVHRTLDNLMKHLTGCKMSKSKSKDWKQTFESRSRIPTIDNADSNTIIMPFIPNINAYDLMVNRKTIENFGACDYAKDLDAEQLLQIIEQIVVQIKMSHDADPPITWGELILPNIIVDKDQHVHICDPETQYDVDVPLVEQKARDLLDFCFSSAAGLHQGDDVDYTKTIEVIVQTYTDRDVLRQLAKLAQKKSSFIQNMFFGYTQVRLGLKDKKEYQHIQHVITEVLQRVLQDSVS